MEILDYISGPTRKCALTEEDRQLLNQCYQDIKLLMKEHKVTIINPHTLNSASLALKTQTGTQNA